MPSVTAKLHRLYQVDKQVRGLRTRINAAERYLQEQERLLGVLDERRKALQAQIRQLEATVKNDEVEMASFDERVEKLREQLNAAKTSKEYSAFLSEINTIKADKGAVEERAIEAMTRLEELRASVTEVDAERKERKGVRDVAAADRDQRAADVRERLEELEAERKQAAEEVPAEALRVFESLVTQRDDEVMAPIEEHSRRHMEYACGACQVLLPVELVSRLLGRGELTRCVNCGSILFVEETLRQEMQPAGKS